MKHYTIRNKGMRGVFLTLFAIVWSCQISNSQSVNNPFSNFRINGHMGMTPLKTSVGNLQISYVDESPSQDYIYSEVPIDKSKFGFNLGLSLDAQSASGFFIRLGIEGALNEIKEFEINFGLGFELISRERMKVRLLGMLSYGSAWINLGDIYQNDTYIEVNNTRFYSPSVAIDLNRRHFLGHPELEFAIPFKQNTSLEFFANIGYQFALKVKTMHLSFTGTDINTENADASESIHANNLDLSLDGQSINSNIIGVTGISARFGISYTF